ncbi:2-amino-4-hydroxy-6-hydroxymethyldihydropteridine pyrophosphokinase [Microvirga lotononidis]|uniref:2-amino-4-hydroxy-6-hydroxymethyldihydropteridine pyrophosphokinase n=1 Tax=Microvirga lotononidis TaxID=864069 RepID=I4YR53_9HYPH|nr:2-amino-4-hydroxy-6-hydroxymethyldihydropteridine pyrophosphokinase [Microvirga lotononidis]
MEREFGRIREVKWGPRVIDIDILTYDDLELNTPTLTLPHPYLGERVFVLVPLADIAPDLNLGSRRVADVLAGLNRGDVTKLA